MTFKPSSKDELVIAVNNYISNKGTSDNSYGTIDTWDTSLITDMSSLFYKKTTFNGEISNWNTSIVNNMSSMFHDADMFNQPIGDWNVSNVTKMRNMFASNSRFNQPIGQWNVSSVDDFYAMFSSSVFNQDISNWKPPPNANMGEMFRNNAVFSQNIRYWNVPNNAGSMFTYSNAMNTRFDGVTGYNYNATPESTFFGLTPQKMVGYVAANATFRTTLTNMSVLVDNISTDIVTVHNNPSIEYNAVITIPSGDFNQLTDENKADLISTTLNLFQKELSVDSNKFIIRLSAGSINITVTVLSDGVTTDNVVNPICFPAGTPVRTDEGEVSIEKLNPDKDTIGGKRIVAITQSTPLDKYIVCIKKDALGKDVPCADTRISNEHGVCYNGKMVKAKELVGLCENVLFIPYNKEILYNVLLEEHGMMMVNNMECETLHPENIMAKIETGKYETSEKRRIYKELTKIFIENDIVGYVRLCMSQNFKK
jgi:hypothetical protein